MPELARQPADGVIDRSKTRDTPCFPLAAKGRLGVWNSHRGNHLGQRSCASAKTGRTYGRKRSDQSTAQNNLARRGPSTYVWNSHRGNHLGQRSCASAKTGRTYGRKRSDQSTAQNNLARRGPSTYGKRPVMASKCFSPICP